MNLVERWFRDITDKRNRRGSFGSVPELITAIKEYLDNHNQNPRIFTWTASAERILAKVAKWRWASLLPPRYGAAADLRRWSAMAAAVATLSESTPGAIAICIWRSAAARVSALRPGPSAPRRRATREGTGPPAPRRAMSSADGSGVSATRV